MGPRPGRRHGHSGRALHRGSEHAAGRGAVDAHRPAGRALLVRRPASAAGVTRPPPRGARAGRGRRQRTQRARGGLHQARRHRGGPYQAAGAGRAGQVRAPAREGRAHLGRLRPHRGPLLDRRQAPDRRAADPSSPGMTLRAAAALSEHPLASHAVGEVAGQLLETVGQNTDLALLFVTAAHAGALDDVAGAVREVLHPRVLLGCTAESVVGGAREVEARPAVSLWAGDVRAGRPFALTAGDTLDVPDDAGALLLLADPFSFPVDELFARLAEIRPGLPVVGGMASAAHGPGGNRLVVDDAVVTEGAVGAFLGPGVEIATVVSQGCRPIGRPFVVTRS